MNPPSDAVAQIVRADLAMRLGLPTLTVGAARAVIVGFGGNREPWKAGPGWSTTAREMIDAYDAEYAPHTDWREIGAVSCACDPKGKDCFCQKLVAVEDDDGDVRLRFQAVEVPNMTKRIDIAETRIDVNDDDPVTAARARRDKQMADAWKAKDAPTTPTSRRVDAISDDDDPVGKARAARDRQMADAWKQRR